MLAGFSLPDLSVEFDQFGQFIPTKCSFDSNEGTELPLQTSWAHAWLPDYGFWSPQEQPARGNSPTTLGFQRDLSPALVLSPSALPSLQPNTIQKGAESAAGKGSEQLKVGMKEMRRKVLYPCIYTPAQPSKARIMQPRVSEYVMNISLDFGTQQNPTRREGLNLAAGTQKISHFIALSLQKTYPHVGIRRPFQVNLIVLFSLWSLRTSELNSAEQQPNL